MAWLLADLAELNDESLLRSLPPPPPSPSSGGPPPPPPELDLRRSFPFPPDLLGGRFASEGGSRPSPGGSSPPSPPGGRWLLSFARLGCGCCFGLGFGAPPEPDAKTLNIGADAPACPNVGWVAESLDVGSCPKLTVGPETLGIWLGDTYAALL